MFRQNHRNRRIENVEKNVRDIWNNVQKYDIYVIGVL